MDKQINKVEKDTHIGLDVKTDDSCYMSIFKKNKAIAVEFSFEELENFIVRLQTAGKAMRVRKYLGLENEF